LHLKIIVALSFMIRPPIFAILLNITAGSNVVKLSAVAMVFVVHLLSSVIVTPALGG
jgi:hypothetical protein